MILTQAYLPLHPLPAHPPPLLTLLQHRVFRLLIQVGCFRGSAFPVSSGQGLVHGTSVLPSHLHPQPYYCSFGNSLPVCRLAPNAAIGLTQCWDYWGVLPWLASPFKGMAHFLMSFNVT